MYDSFKERFRITKGRQRMKHSGKREYESVMPLQITLTQKIINSTYLKKHIDTVEEYCRLLELINFSTVLN